MVIIIVVSADAYYCLIIVLSGERERDREKIIARVPWSPGF